jgi:hypothetical protein
MSARPNAPVARRARLARLAAALPLLAAFACADPTGPAAPPAAPEPAAPLAAIAASEVPGPAEAAAAADASVAAVVGDEVYSGTDFSNVQLQAEGMGFAVLFKYSGVITPAFTVGTSDDVYSTQVATVAAKKLLNGYWTAKIGGLTPGTKYHMRLDNYKNFWYQQAMTLRRQVTMDLDSIKVISDGDWGPNCGDLINWMTAGDHWASGYHYNLAPGIRTSERCVDSGETMVLSNSYGSTLQLWNYTKPVIYVMHRLLDADSCYEFEMSCGSMALSFATGADVIQSGTKKFVVKTEESWDGYQSSSVVAIWYYKVIVKYLPAM